VSRHRPEAADDAEARKPLILLARAKRGEIEGAVAAAAELKRIAAGADDIAGETVACLKLQRVRAAGEGDGIGPRDTVTAEAARDRAGVDESHVGAGDASAASAGRADDARGAGAAAGRAGETGVAAQTRKTRRAARAGGCTTRTWRTGSAASAAQSATAAASPGALMSGAARGATITADDAAAIDQRATVRKARTNAAITAITAIAAVA